MSHDTLSDVLRTVRLRSALFFYVSCRGKWAAEAPPSRDIAAAVLPGADHVIEYHVVTEGECWAAIVGQSPLKLRPGDIIMLPQGDPHVMSYAPGMRANPYTSAYYEMKHHYRPFLVSYDSDGQPQVVPRTMGSASTSDDDASARLVCGFIGCDLRPFNPLIAALPRLLHLSADRGGAWSEQFVRLAAAESASRRAGSEALLERLSEMMFVDAVRRHADSMPEQSRAGSPDCATASSGAPWRSCTRTPPPPGRWTTWANRWVSRARRCTSVSSI